MGLLCVGAVACDDDVSQFVFDALVVDGNAGNPAAGTDAETLRIGIQEGELLAAEYEYPIDDGDFEGRLELSLFSAPTRIRVAIEGPTTELLTAPPELIPAFTNGFMRVVTAAPRSCESVTFDLMEAPRAFFGMVQSGTFALIAGGATSSDEQIEFLDALEWESRLFTEDFSVPALGETRAATIGEGEILVLPSSSAPFIFDMLDVAQRVTSVVLHVGAGPRSALVSVPGLGAMVIGGEVGGEAQSAVSLVQPGGAVTSLELSEPRSGAAAAALGTDVLVAGGNEQGDAEILLDGLSTGRPVTMVMDGVRDDGFLVSDGESRALWLGGTDDAGALRQDTVRFDACPSACAADAGPTWPDARPDSVRPERSTLIIGGEESTKVDEVRWSGEDVRIEPLLELNAPRAGAGAIVFESGLFVVGGGNDSDGRREDFEVCVPEALKPL